MSDLTFLVNPSERAILRDAGDRPPLGLLYIAKELDKHSHDVKVFDLNHDEEERMFDEMAVNQPQMVGVSCLTSPMVKESRRLLKKSKQFSPKSRLVVGGYHPSVMPNDFKDVADNAVVGEGEYALECLVSNIQDTFEFTNGVTNLEALGRPARKLVDMSKYNMQMDGMRTATMITSRGCPNECVFCGNQRNKIRKHDLFDLEDEVAELKNLGYEAVYILDDVFTADKPRAMWIANLLKEKELPFRCTTRANYLNEGLVKNLAKNGCDIVSMGVESGNDEILKSVGKNQNKNQIREAITMLHSYGIKSKGFFIIGLPGETEATARQTLDFAKELREKGMAQADFYPLIPYPGTKIWSNPEDFGLEITDRDYANYLQAERQGVHVPCRTKQMDNQTIKSYITEAREEWKM